MKPTQDDLTKIKDLYNTYLRLNELLTYEEVLLDKKLCYKYEKDRENLSSIAEKYEEYIKLNELLNEFKNETCVSDELDELNTKLEQLSSELKLALINLNSTNQEIVVEIVGSKNSDTLIKDIVSGYINFAKVNGYTVKQAQEKTTTYLNISGNNIKDIFLREAGIHSSTDESCSVFVYESYKEEDISFTDKDIEISVTRSSGAGGQHINTTDSAIKITHLKTGITATCQSERNQIQNRDKALNVLKERVCAHYSELKQNHITKSKKEQVKLIKNNHIAKNYNYELGVITKNTKQSISLKNFLLGKEI